MLIRVFGHLNTRPSSFEEYTSFWEKGMICEVGSNGGTETNNTTEKRCRLLKYLGRRLPRVGAGQSGEDCADDAEHQSGIT
jgi:hypothetical protein